MKNEYDDLLDTPVSTPQRTPIWAIVGAIGIAGILTSMTLYLTSGLWREIRVEDSLRPLAWVQMLTLASQLSLLFGVVLTVLRKEPKSTFRSWVIGIGSVLLLIMLLLVGFAYYMDASQGR